MHIFTLECFSLISIYHHNPQAQGKRGSPYPFSKCRGLRPVGRPCFHRHSRVTFQPPSPSQTLAPDCPSPPIAAQTGATGTPDRTGISLPAHFRICGQPHSKSNRATYTAGSDGTNGTQMVFNICLFCSQVALHLT